MAQIYKEQVIEERTPITPDTSLMSYFDKKRQAGLEGVGNFAQIQLQRHAKEVQGLKDLTYKQATQVYKNAYEIYNDDPKKYKEMVSKGLTEIYDTIPDNEFKQQIQAEVAIAGSGYDARVQRNIIDKNERINNMYIKDATFAMIDSAKKNSGALFEAFNNAATPAEKEKYLQAYNDSLVQMKMAEGRKNAVTRNGTPLFSTSERAIIEDASANFNRYAVLDYVGANVQDNRAGVVELFNYMKNNKEKFMAEAKVDEESWAKTVKDVDSCLRNQTTAADAVKMSQLQADIDANYNSMDIKEGKVGVAQFDNLTDTIGVYQKVKDAESMGAYTDNPEKAAKLKGDLSNVIINQLESGASVKQRRNIFQRIFGVNENVGETTLSRINSNIEEISPMLEGKNIDINELKADMAIDALGQLQSQKSVQLGSKEPDYIYEAKAVADSALYKQLNKYCGDLVNIPEDKKNDYTYVRNEYMRAMTEYDNNTALNFFDKFIETSNVQKEMPQSNAVLQEKAAKEADIFIDNYGK